MRTAAWQSIVESLEGRRLLAQIGVDHTFGEDGTEPVGGDILFQQVGDKLLTIGRYVDYQGHAVNVHRLNLDGTIDTSFGKDGGISVPQLGDETVATISGQEVLGVYEDQLSTVRMVVFDLNGKIDTTIGKDGMVEIAPPPAPHLGETIDHFEPLSIAPMPNGEAIVSVDYSYTDANGEIDDSEGLIEIKPNGTLDTSFGNDGLYVVSTIHSNDNGALFGATVATDSKGVITFLAGTTSPSDDLEIVRLNPDGTADTSFGNGGIVHVSSFESAVPTDELAFTLGADGKLIAGGNVFNPDGADKTQLFRLNTDGTLDKTFGDSGIVQLPQVELIESLTVDSQGRLILTNGESVYRLTSAGQLDTTFNGSGMFTLPDKISGGNAAVDASDQLYVTDVFDVTRLAETAPATLARNGELFVTGTDNGDQIGITNNAGKINCTVNDQTFKFDPTAVKQIFIDPSDGNDDVNSSIDVPTTVAPGSGDDMITTGDAIDRIICGLGNDTIDAGGGDDYVHASTGNYTIHGGAGNDVLRAPGSASAVIFGDDGNDSILGTAGNDSLYGGAGGDTIRAGGGNDLLSGGGGRDHLLGQPGSDRIYAGNGNDAIDAGPGNDRIFGQAGDDVIMAGSGNDQIDGGPGSDYLAAGPGDDTLTANDGERDSVYGGDGTDTAITDPSLDVLRSIEM